MATVSNIDEPSTREQVEASNEEHRRDQKKHHGHHRHHHHHHSSSKKSSKNEHDAASDETVLASVNKVSSHEKEEHHHHHRHHHHHHSSSKKSSKNEHKAASDETVQASVNKASSHEKEEHHDHHRHHHHHHSSSKKSSKNEHDAASDEAVLASVNKESSHKKEKHHHSHHDSHPHTEVLSDGTCVAKYTKKKGLRDGSTIVCGREDEMVQPSNFVQSNAVDGSIAGVDKGVYKDKERPLRYSGVSGGLTLCTDVDVPILASQISHAKEADHKQTKTKKPATIQLPDDQNIPIPMAVMHLKDDITDAKANASTITPIQIANEGDHPIPAAIQEDVVYQKPPISLDTPSILDDVSPVPPSASCEAFLGNNHQQHLPPVYGKSHDDPELKLKACKSHSSHNSSHIKNFAPEVGGVTPSQFAVYRTLEQDDTAQAPRPMSQSDAVQQAEGSGKDNLLQKKLEIIGDDDAPLPRSYSTSIVSAEQINQTSTHSEESIAYPPKEEESEYSVNRQYPSTLDHATNFDTVRVPLPVLQSTTPPHPSIDNTYAQLVSHRQPNMFQPNDNDDEPLILEAMPVDEPLYDAIPIETPPWWKHYLKSIFAGFGLILVAMAVALGVGFGMENVPSTLSPTVSMSPSMSASPTDSMVPSFQPSARPSFFPRQCFTDLDELKSAVDAYTSSSQNCSKADVCEVTRVYGWPISSWCVSKITDMSDLFFEAVDFNDDLTYWDVSSVTSMAGIFYKASSFNGDVANWDTGSVLDFTDSFRGASVFNRNITSWNTTSAVTLNGMFYEASKFNGDLSKWITSSVRDMSFMFWHAASFDGNLNLWDVSKVTSMEKMFNGASEFSGNKSLSSWDTSSCTNMIDMFFGATKFSGDVSNWDVSSVLSISGIFYETQFSGDLSNWDVSSVLDLSYAFYSTSEFNSNLTLWDTSKVVNMQAVFYGAALFNGDISKWDTSSVTDMVGMFAKAYAFEGNLALWNTSKVTSMAYMFNEAQKFSGDISMWDISNVIDMSGMFYAAGAFNRNLCVWGNSSFPYTSATDIFFASGCTFADDPEQTQKGPFCASECNGR